MAKVYIEQPFRKSGRGWSSLIPLYGNIVSKAIEPIRDGEVVSVKVAKVDKPKTNSQLGYYWSVVLPSIYNHMHSEGETFTININDSCCELPVTKDVVHCMLKSMLSGIASMADMKASDASEFIDNCIMFAAKNYNLVIEPPNTQKGK
jgi:hypothetical protein